MRLVPMWTLDAGLTMAAQVQAGSRKFGYHVALGGGVLNRGESFKDLDVYFLPLDSDTMSPDSAGVLTWLESLWGVSESINDPNYGPSPYYKLKLKFYPENRRIDVFVVGG